MTQLCYSNHDLRVRRHDDLCSYVRRSLEQRNFTVHSEPKFHLPDDKTLKPDPIAYSTNNIFCLDLQVINNQYSLQKAHENKVKKYRVLKPQIDPFRGKGVFFFPAKLIGVEISAGRVTSSDKLPSVESCRLPYPGCPNIAMVFSSLAHVPVHDLFCTKREVLPGFQEGPVSNCFCFCC